MHHMKKLILALTFCSAIFSASSSAQVTDVDLPAFKNIFNSYQGYTRIVFLGDPTCPGCIATASDLRNSIFGNCNNPNLRGLIVWIHVQGFNSVKNDAITQCALWSDPRVTCYWDSLWDISYAFGYQGGWAGCNWAWDIDMIYTDVANWTGTYPPAPYYCMSKTGCCNSYNVSALQTQLNALAACSSAGVADLFVNSHGLIVSPNPGTDVITLSWPGATARKNSRLSIFNALGEAVLQTSDTPKTDISGLPPGLYSILLSDGNNIYSARFLKK